jgi:hypothetical protein
MLTALFTNRHITSYRGKKVHKLTAVKTEMARKMPIVHKETVLTNFWQIFATRRIFFDGCNINQYFLHPEKIGF